MFVAIVANRDLDVVQAGPKTAGIDAATDIFKHLVLIVDRASVLDTVVLPLIFGPRKWVSSISLGVQ